MKNYSILILFLLAFGNELAGQQALGSIKLWQSEVSEIRLKKVLKKDTPTLFIFLGSTCPICQKYTGLLRELPDRYPGVQVIGIFTKWEKWSEIHKFAEEYDLQLPLLLDKNHRLLEALGATVTPEAFLLNEKGEVVYQGAIDNWFYDLGKPRARVTENYLTDALDSFLKGAEISTKITKPIGCVIGN